MAVHDPVAPGLQSSLAARAIGIKELVDDGLSTVPAVYVRPPSERPEPYPAKQQHRIPVINLAALTADSGSDGAARRHLLDEISHACEQWGFFQVIDHGVETSVIRNMQDAARRFFDQPAEERMRLFSQTYDSPVTYVTSFNPSMEQVREWKDTLGFNRYPGTRDGFLEAPDICKKEVQAYIAQVECLAKRLYKAIFESLGLQAAYVDEEVPGISRTRLAINYYPPCPDPSLTLGLSSHSDTSSLTILHPDEVPGLEIRHEGSWVPVVPFDSSAFVVNLADQTEILTNGRYKSVEHRVRTNAERHRVSMASFFGPREETIVAPLPALIDGSNPPRFKPTKFGDYFRNFLSSRLLPNRGTLDFARIHREDASSSPSVH